jgi:hypothetical protein
VAAILILRVVAKNRIVWPATTCKPLIICENNVVRAEALRSNISYKFGEGKAMVLITGSVVAILGIVVITFNMSYVEALMLYGI